MGLGGNGGGGGGGGGGGAGPAGANGTPNWTGPWSSATAYEVGDAVASAGSAYVCNTAHTNHTPPNVSFWDVLAAKGTAGDAGPAGNDGNDGSDGSPGTAGAPGTPSWKGAWDSGTTYEPGDAVSDAGSSYVANAENTNDEPPSANWDLLAGKGDAGSPGPTDTAAEAQGPPLPALVGATPDTSFNPLHTWATEDLSTADSYYGADRTVALVSFTPAADGTLTLLAPLDDGYSNTIYFDLFTGDAPTRDGTGTPGEYVAESSLYTDPRPIIGGDLESYSTSDYQLQQVAVTAGQPYTIAAYSTAPTGTNVGQVYDLTPLLWMAQSVGAVATVLPWVQAGGSLAHAEGYGSRARGIASHAEGQSQAGGQFAHAEGRSTATADASHAEGMETQALGFASHAEGLSTYVTADRAHGEGYNTVVTGQSAHGEGQGCMASEHTAHAEGWDTVASGIASHAEGSDTRATTDAAHAEGQSAVAALYAEHAHSSTNFDVVGDSQYSRLVPVKETTDATPTPLGLAHTGYYPLTVPAGQTWQVLVQLVATNHTTPGTVAGWILKGLITSAGGALRIVGSPTEETWADGGASTWDASLAVSADHLDITVTGEADTTIRWVATVHATRVGA